MSDAQRSRREFIKAAAATGVGFSWLVTSAASYARVLGANDRIGLAFVGARSRGKELITAAFKAGGGRLDVPVLCDVDANVLAERAAALKELAGSAPRTEKDFRRVLDDKAVDAVIIATPDHTHAPFGVHALQAGKHVYIEKPCSHNAYEGELLVKAWKRHGKLVQMGNQQRSAPTSMEAIRDIRDGMIGRPYMAKAWYANARGSIGKGKAIAVPDSLDWDLWQGPAPRRPFQDNLVHYNWHWFWHWGTGEINNNGLHEMDICRWALDVDYPQRVTSSGGRYHFDDDWQFYDTQVASFEFAGGKLITWEGRSCNPFKYFDRARGATIHGTHGTVLLDRNGYALQDNAGNLVKQVNERAVSGTIDPVGGGALDQYHLENFFAAIRSGETLHSPIDEGHKSTLMCHLGNIAQRFGRALTIDARNGHIQDDKEAMSLWRREYASGWEPAV